MPPAAAAQLAASAAAAAGQHRRGPGAGGQVARALRRGLAPPGGLTEGRRARAASAHPRAGGESSSLAQKAMQTGASTIFREGGVAAGVTVPFVCPERGRLSASPARGSRGPAWAGDPRGRERPDPGQTSGSWCQPLATCAPRAWVQGPRRGPELAAPPRPLSWCPHAHRRAAVPQAVCDRGQVPSALSGLSHPPHAGGHQPQARPWRCPAKGGGQSTYVRVYSCTCIHTRPHLYLRPHSHTRLLPPPRFSTLI